MKGEALAYFLVGLQCGLFLEGLKKIIIIVNQETALVVSSDGTS